MRKPIPDYLLLFIATMALLALASCNNQSADIPFPVSDSGYSQPTLQPLQFSAAKKLNWLTVQTGGIKSVVKKLDIDALPSAPYDATGFKPFPKQPEETHFDFNALPEAALNIDKIPSDTLRFRTTVLPTPVIVRSARLSPKAGTPLSISDMGQPQGLTEKFILCLIKDKSGFIWIGTNKGLYRYDGEYMKKYEFLSYGVVDMIEDDNGRIWCINRRGIGIVDTKNGILKFSTNISTPFPGIPKMIRDAKGNIWVSQTASKGATIINPQSQTYKHLDKSRGLSGSYTWGMLEDAKKNIWLSSDDGLDIINTITGKIKYFKKANGLSSDSLQAITTDEKGSVWIGVQNGGVEEVNIQKGSIKSYGVKQGLNNKNTFNLFFDNRGLLWLATNHGLAIADPAKGRYRYFPGEEGINDDFVLDILLDDKQRVWAATFQTGLMIIDEHADVVFPIGKKAMSTMLESADGKIWLGTANDGIEIVDQQKNLARFLKKEQGLSHNGSQNLVEEDNNIWFTSGGGLDIIDPRRKTLEHIGRKEGLSSDTIYSILRDSKRNIWFTGPSEGVDLIDSAKKTLLHAGIEEGFSDYNIVDVKQDNEGLVWIATGSGGVDVVDPSNWSIKFLNNAPGLKDTCNRILMADKFGRMWIGTDKGIYIADTKKGTLTAISTKEGLPHNNITSLNEYNGQIIAGTNNRVSIIIPPKSSDEKWKISLLAKSEPLVKASVTWNSDLITKKGQFLWGDNGVTIINNIREEHDSAATFISGISIMSQPQHFSNVAHLNERDTLWSTDSFYVKGQMPVKTGYSYQSGLFGWDSLSGPYNMPLNLHIPYDQNYLQFQFAQLHLGRQDAAQYSYILEGIDKQWSAFTTNPFTENYLNLAPGDYTFKVSSKDISGRWGQPATFSFTITPPWWKTWWAYTIYALIFFGALWGFIYYRSEKLRRENRVLEEKVEHRTTQLKKSLEELRSTQTQLIQSEKMASLGELTAGIAHEIQNPLNFVNNFSEVNTELADELKEELNKISIPAAEKSQIEKIADDIKQNQEKINYHGKRADAIVKGMLQHSRSSNGQREPRDINGLADEYLRLAYHGLRAKDKSFNATMKTDYDQSIGNINIIPQDMGRVILNLITNAFYAVTEKKKQHPDGYEPTVSVRTKKMGNKVLISVKDNGNGVPQKVMDKIFQPFFTTKPPGQGTGLGLSLSYDTIKVHGGELKVETKEGEYAEFIIVLPV